jgi:hypothetical protein
MFFQRGEADLGGGVVDLSQESRVAMGMYLSFKTECQIPVWVLARQRVLVARAWVECRRFGSPNLLSFLVWLEFPNCTGVGEMWFEHPDQRKLKDNFLSLSSTEVGMDASAIQ